ncbi:hypothetical protein R1sor_016041 [Riccia sorocarpa]|uniref:Uncharacterized protein n=1 Tax=Riccia sorocarpa TaxID=122646 RepID=A0ABD3HDX8_9MARC
MKRTAAPDPNVLPDQQQKRNDLIGPAGSLISPPGNTRQSLISCSVRALILPFAPHTTTPAERDETRETYLRRRGAWAEGLALGRATQLRERPCARGGGSPDSQARELLEPGRATKLRQQFRAHFRKVAGSLKDSPSVQGDIR